MARSPQASRELVKPWASVKHVGYGPQNTVNRCGHGYAVRLERQKTTQETLWQHECRLYCLERFRSFKMCYLCKISEASILVEAGGS